MRYLRSITALLFIAIFMLGCKGTSVIMAFKYRNKCIAVLANNEKVRLMYLTAPKKPTDSIRPPTAPSVQSQKAIIIYSRP